MDSQRLTYAFWFSPSSAIGSPVFAGRYTKAYFLLTAASMKLSFKSSSRANEPGEHPTVLTVGKRYFIVGVTEPGRSSVWVNDVKGPVGTSAAAITWAAEALALGDNTVANSVGVMGPFLAWNRALTDKEVHDLWVEQTRQTLFRRIPLETVITLWSPPFSEMIGQIVDPTIVMTIPGGVTPSRIETIVEIVNPGVIPGNLPVTPTPLEVLAVTETAPTIVISAAGKNVRVTRFAMEVAAKRVGVVIPLPLPTTIPALMLHDWAQTAQVDTTWQTDVTDASSSVSEERRGLVRRPVRLVSARLLGLSRARAAKLLLGIARRGQARSLFPVYSDQSRVTAVSSGTTVNCSTRWRRIYVGQRVAVVKFAASGPASVEYGQVKSMTASTIELVGALSDTYPLGSRLYPLIDAEVSLDADAELMSDEVAGVTLSAMEVAGPSAIPASSYEPPLSLPRRYGVPILDVRVDWAGSVSSKIVRSGSYYARGRAQVAFLRGQRPQWEHTVSFTSLTRAGLWKLLQFFDSRRGRLEPFILVSPGSMLKFVATSGVTLDVLPEAGNVVDVDAFLDHVAVVGRDGTVHVRKIVSVVDQTTHWRVTIDDPLPALAAVDVRRVTGAHLVRLTEDSMSEAWVTDEACRVTLTARDVLEEKSVVVVNLADYRASPPPATVGDLFLWLDASRNTWAFQNTDGSGSARHHLARADDAGLDAERISQWEDARLVDPRRVSPAWLDTGAISLPSQAIQLPRLYRDLSPEFNNGRRLITVPSSTDYTNYYRLKPDGVNFFSNALGLTIFAVLRKNKWNPSNSFPSETQAEGTGILYRAGVIYLWTNHARLYETLGAGAQDITYPTIDDRGFLIYVLTWKPATYGRVYFNGGTPVGTISANITSLPEDFVADTDILKLKGNVSPGSTDWHLRHGFDALLIYRRALEATELNTVGEHLSRSYDIPWSAIS